MRLQRVTGLKFADYVLFMLRSTKHIPEGIPDPAKEFKWLQKIAVFQMRERVEGPGGLLINGFFNTVFLCF